MKQVMTNLLWRVANRFSPEEIPDQGTVQVNYSELVAKAREEWQAARALFEHVSDPDLVDHAIALITATEKKYTYLLRQAKIDGASSEVF